MNVNETCALGQGVGMASSLQDKVAEMPMLWALNEALNKQIARMSSHIASIAEGLDRIGVHVPEPVSNANQAASPYGPNLLDQMRCQIDLLQNEVDRIASVANRVNRLA